MKAEDRTGQIFGNLQVIGFDEEESAIRSEKYGKKIRCWKCKCIVCGHETTKPLAELTFYKNKGRTGCIKCALPDLTGKRIGRLVVLHEAEKRNSQGHRKWVCQCDCGNIATITGTDLTKENPTQSCGCLQKEITSRIKTGSGIWQGASTDPKYKRIYRIWDGMKRRCEDPTNKRYDSYGNRGISICKEWHDFNIFKEWALNNGYQDDLTIERSNVNRNYEPNNCTWIPFKDQGKNRQNTRRITYKGQTHLIPEWSEITGLPLTMLYSRLNPNSNFTVEEAFELPKYAHPQKYREHMKEIQRKKV